MKGGNASEKDQSPPRVFERHYRLLIDLEEDENKTIARRVYILPSNLWTNALSWRLFEEGAPRRRGRTYHVVFRQASRINLRQLAQYLAGEPVPLPQEALQVMDVVLRQAAIKYFVEKGRSFYGPLFGKEKLQGGLLAYRGFYQSVRPAQQNLLTLNIDIAAAPFYDPVDLHIFIGNSFRKDPRELNSIFSRNDSTGDGMRSRIIWRGSKIHSWTLVNFASSVAPQAVQNFCNKLPELCLSYGVPMNPQMAIPMATETNGNVEGVVRYLMRSAEERNKQPLQLIFCIMPQTENKQLYVARHVLQYGTWNIVGSLAYVQSWRANFNPEDHGQAHYPLWIEFLALPADMRPFVDLFAHRFGKVLIPDGRRNTFRANLRGTSRPAHYNVLKDENGFSADDIQRLTNDLCFTFLPEAFGRLSMLVSLNLSNNKFQVLSDSIAGLVSLEILDLSCNLLASLPDSIGLLKSLKLLNVSSNKLKTLPDSISRCSELIELDASYNQLIYLPTNLGQELVKLQKLSVHLNKLRSLPSSVCEMKSLRYLDVHFNELRSLPAAIGNLTNLQVLNASSNFSDLVSIPDSIGELINLVELDLSNNQIRQLPYSFGSLQNLKKLSLDQNPLLIPPEEIVKQGVDAVTEYMAKRWLDYLLEEEQRSTSDTRTNQTRNTWVQWGGSVFGGWISGVKESVTGYLGASNKSHTEDYLEQQY